VPRTLTGEALLEFKQDRLCWTLLVAAHDVVGCR
jgi:hypothetical protein